MPSLNAHSDPYVRTSVRPPVLTPFVAERRNCCRCGIEFRGDSMARMCPDCRKPKEQAPRLGKALSFRERQIAALVWDAKANKEIAYELHLTEGTVKEYLNHIYAKLGIGDRMQLMRWWLEHESTYHDCSQCLLRKIHTESDAA